MAPSLLFSLIVPTRGRPERLQAFLASVAATAERPDAIEVILVIDDDDPASAAVEQACIRLQRVLVRPGLTMGALNTAGYAASAGRYIMLLNDDVLVRTPGWDTRISACFTAVPDEILLVHVNDTVFQKALCTFPIVSRTFCSLAGGICPAEYIRYRIDDHLEDVFNLLGILGERRSVYLPDVVFEHANHVTNPDGVRQYFADPAILAIDAPTFDALRPTRKDLAIRLRAFIDERASAARAASWRNRLEGAPDAAALRVPERLRVVADSGLREPAPAVTIGICTADGGADTFGTCLDAVRKHTRDFDLVIVDGRGCPGYSSARAMNQVLDAARGDYVVLLEDDALVGPGWLDALFVAMRGNIGLVSPLHSAAGDDDAWGGFVFAPDRPGRHGHLRADAEGPRLALGVCNPCMLLDRTKCRGLRFDEAYGVYFADVDFGLHVWERGHAIACAATVVRHLRPGPRPYGHAVDPDRFAADRQRFADRWIASGRIAALRGVWAGYPELRRLLDLDQAAMALLTRTPDESLDAYDLRSRRVLADLQRAPIVRQAVMCQAAGTLAGRPLDPADQDYGHLVWLLGRCGRPVVIGANDQGNRIVLCERFYALPAREGEFNAERLRRGEYRVVYAADTRAILHERIRAGLAEELPRPPRNFAVRLVAAGATKAWKAWACVQQVGWRGFARIVHHKARARMQRLLRPLAG